VHCLLARAARAVAAANKRIRALIILARVICADETPVRWVGPEDPQEVPAGRLHEPAHLLLPRRSVDEDLQRVRVLPGHRSGVVVVHDRYVNYDKFPGVMHQLCTAHLLRDVEDAAETYPDAIWPGQIAGKPARPHPRRE